MAHETYEQYRQRKQRQRDDFRRWPAMLDEKNPEHWIYPMPTVEEVVAAGYAADYHARVALDREELVRRFSADVDFRAAWIARVRDLRRGSR